MRQHGHELILQTCHALGLPACGLLRLALECQLLQQALDCFRQVIEVVAGLGQYIGYPRAQGFDDAQLVRHPRDHDGGNDDALRTQAAEEIQAAIECLQVVVDDEQVRHFQGHGLARCLGLGDRRHAVAVLAQDPTGQRQQAVVIFQDQDMGCTGGHRDQTPFWPPASAGSLTTCRKKPRRRTASMKSSYSTGLVM